MRSPSAGTSLPFSTRTLLILAASLLLSVVAAAAGWRVWRGGDDNSHAAQYRRRMEALDDLRATGAISDADYDRRAKALLVDPRDATAR